MKFPFRNLLALASLLLAGNVLGLEKGDDCPDFSLKGSDGHTYSLSDLKGKAPFVIAWYPKAFTGG